MSAVKIKDEPIDFNEINVKKEREEDVDPLSSLFDEMLDDNFSKQILDKLNEVSSSLIDSTTGGSLSDSEKPTLSEKRVRSQERDVHGESSKQSKKKKRKRTRSRSRDCERRKSRSRERVAYSRESRSTERSKLGYAERRTSAYEIRRRDRWSGSSDRRRRSRSRSRRNKSSRDRDYSRERRSSRKSRSNEKEKSPNRSPSDSKPKRPTFLEEMEVVFAKQNEELRLKKQQEAKIIAAINTPAVPISTYCMPHNYGPQSAVMLNQGQMYNTNPPYMAPYSQVQPTPPLYNPVQPRPPEPVPINLDDFKLPVPIMVKKDIEKNDEFSATETVSLPMPIIVKNDNMTNVCPATAFDTVTLPRPIINVKGDEVPVPIIVKSDSKLEQIDMDISPLSESVLHCEDILDVPIEEIPLPPKFQLEDFETLSSDSEEKLFSRRVPSPDIGFKRIKLTKPVNVEVDVGIKQNSQIDLADVPLENKTTPRKEVNKTSCNVGVNHKVSDLDNVKAALKRIKQFRKQSFPEKLLYTSKIYIPDAVDDFGRDLRLINKSVLSKINSPAYTFSSPKPVDFRNYGFIDVPPVLGRVCNALQYDANQIMKNLYSLDETHILTNDNDDQITDNTKNEEPKGITRLSFGTQTESINITPPKRGFNIGVQTVVYNASIGTQTEETSSSLNESMPLMRIMKKLNPNQLLALNDYAEIIFEKGTSLGDPYIIRGRLMDIFNSSLRPDAKESSFPNNQKKRSYGNSSGPFSGRRPYNSQTLPNFQGNPPSGPDYTATGSPMPLKYGRGAKRI